MKTWVKQRFPFFRPVVRTVRSAQRKARLRPTDLRRFVRRTLSKGLPLDTAESRFRRIYRMNLWRGNESRCGPGSSLEETAVVRSALPGLVERLGVRSVLDIPCGDFSWMKQVPLELESYVGADVVSHIIEENDARFGSATHAFVRLDIQRDALPRADLVLCRDCLDHFSLSDASAALRNIERSGSTYLLATTYPGRDVNPEIRTGDWRPLNLQLEPFRLPAPIDIVHEASQKPGYPDKSLGLWRIADFAGP